MNLEVLSRYPSGRAHPTPLLFVHGAWHGAWCWNEHFLEYFARQGFAAHAVSLRGHGASDGRERLRWNRIADYVKDVATVADQMHQPPAVIGHSMGGLVVQKYLERHLAPCAVLMASVPPAGVLATTLRVARRHPLVFAKINLTLSLHPLVATPQLAHEMLFSDALSEDLAFAYARRLQDESYAGFLDMLAFDLPQPQRVTAPILVLGAEDDAIFHPSEVEATARAYRTDATMFPGMAHDMMLEAGWETVADRILLWLRQRA